MKIKIDAVSTYYQIMKFLAIISTLIILFGVSCKKFNDHSFTLNNITFKDWGDEKQGFCGIVLYGTIGPKPKSYTCFKVNNLHDSLLKNTAYTYTAKVALIPNKTSHCMNETVDPMPGQPFPSSDLQYIQIIEIKRN